MPLVEQAGRFDRDHFLENLPLNIRSPQRERARSLLANLRAIIEHLQSYPVYIRCIDELTRQVNRLVKRAENGWNDDLNLEFEQALYELRFQRDDGALLECCRS